MRKFTQIDNGNLTGTSHNSVFINHQLKTFSIGHIGDHSDDLEDHALSEISLIIELLQSVHNFAIKEGLISEQ